ncbi:MAG: G5 domain-containing protein [Clostridia bacterium]|nr:G5 domain-containing protein [Clostridia bacterium]
MMLQKAKAFFAKHGEKAQDTAKRGIKAAVNVTLAALLVAVTFIASAQTVSITDGEDRFSVKGYAEDVGVLVAGLELKSNKYEVVDVKNELFSTEVSIEYLVPLTVKIGDKTSTYDVKAGKLGDILNDLDIEVEEHDILSCSLDTFVDKAKTLEITDVEYDVEVFTESIPYSSDIVYSDKYDTNTKFTTVGKAGTKTVTCSVKYVNGVKVETSVLREEITEYAVDSKTVYGTKAPQHTSSGIVAASGVACISKLKAPANLLLDKNGAPVKYSSKVTLRATAYTHTGNKTSTGVWPKPGYVAVDPKEIPYGTKMYIVSSDGKYVYGYAIAADTGGFIYGNRADMDLFLDSEAECVKFGRRNITVYFLED